MRPVATVREIRSADRAALGSVDHATLVRRAGIAVGGEAMRILGNPYGRRVVVLAGKGDNGADGLVAAALLRRRGAHIRAFRASEAPSVLPRCDLVIDAAYGTGFHGSYDAPRAPRGAMVLAVDIPSGIDADSGSVSGAPLRADRTVTFAAWKPGLLQGEGARLSGEVRVVDIGVGVPATAISLMGDEDLVMLSAKTARSHKWDSAVMVVAGSPGMEGAACLAANGALHAGAGMVLLMVPGSADHLSFVPAPIPWPVEAVRPALPATGWAGQVLEASERCRAVIIGPGLGRHEGITADIRKVIDGVRVPVVADADAFAAFEGPDGARSMSRAKPSIVLTPHDGEYTQLAGSKPGSDRIAAGRALARATGAVVLLKGALTTVASPAGGGGVAEAESEEGAKDERQARGNDLDDREGRVLLSNADPPQSATAGSGDVLSGMIGAFMARGIDVNHAAALAAHVHGRAARSGHSEGMVAGDLPALVSGWLSNATSYLDTRTDADVGHGS